VRLIEPSAFTKISALGVEEQRVNVIGDFEKPAPLGDGYQVEVAIEVWHGDDVLQIPSSALFRWHGEWNVFALENGVARRRALVVGQSNPEAAEVLQGLAEGEVVILHPSDEVADGVRVRAVGE